MRLVQTQLAPRRKRARSTDYWRPIAALLFLASLAPVARADVALLLFGGEDHKTFLGCVNCGRYESSSICNKYGDQGSKYATDSIWNKYGDFGSRYSSLSPWNKYASDPPVIVDNDGAFYGYFTANPYHAKRTEIPQLVALADAWEQVTEDPQAASDKFCGRD